MSPTSPPDTVTAHEARAEWYAGALGACGKDWKRASTLLYWAMHEAHAHKVLGMSSDQVLKHKPPMAKKGTPDPGFGAVDPLAAASLHPTVLTAALSSLGKGGQWRRAVALLNAAENGHAMNAAVAAEETQSDTDKLNATMSAVGELNGILAPIGMAAATDKASSALGDTHILKASQRRLKGSHHLPAIAWATAMSACGRSGEWEAALKLLDAMVAASKSASGGPAPNAPCYSACLSALERAGQGPRAVQLLAQMQGLPLGIDSGTASGAPSGSKGTAAQAVVRVTGLHRRAALGACGSGGHWQHAIGLLGLDRAGLSLNSAELEASNTGAKLILSDVEASGVSEMATSRKFASSVIANGKPLPLEAADFERALEGCASAGKATQSNNGGQGAAALALLAAWDKLHATTSTGDRSGHNDDVSDVSNDALVSAAAHDSKVASEPTGKKNSKKSKKKKKQQPAVGPVTSTGLAFAMQAVRADPSSLNSPSSNSHGDSVALTTMQSLLAEFERRGLVITEAAVEAAIGALDDASFEMDAGEGGASVIASASTSASVQRKNMFLNRGEDVSSSLWKEGASLLLSAKAQHGHFASLWPVHLPAAAFDVAAAAVAAASAAEAATAARAAKADERDLGTLNDDEMMAPPGWAEPVGGKPKQRKKLSPWAMRAAGPWDPPLVSISASGLPGKSLSAGQAYTQGAVKSIEGHAYPGVVDLRNCSAEVARAALWASFGPRTPKQRRAVNFSKAQGWEGWSQSSSEAYDDYDTNGWGDDYWNEADAKWDMNQDESEKLPLGGYRRKAKFGGGGSTAILLAPSLKGSGASSDKREANERQLCSRPTPLDEAGALECLLACAEARMRTRQHALLVAEKPTKGSTPTSAEVVSWQGANYVWRDAGWQEVAQPPVCLLVRIDGSAEKIIKK